MMQPMIQIFLKLLNSSIEGLMGGFSEELIQDGPIESLYESISLGGCHLGFSMFDITQF